MSRGHDAVRVPVHGFCVHMICARFPLDISWSFFFFINFFCCCCCVSFFIVLFVCLFGREGERLVVCALAFKNVVYMEIGRFALVFPRIVSRITCFYFYFFENLFRVRECLCEGGGVVSGARSLLRLVYMEITQRKICCTVANRFVLCLLS